MPRENVKTFSRWIIGCKDKDGAREFLQESLQQLADAIEATDETNTCDCLNSHRSGEGNCVCYTLGLGC